MLTQYAKDSSLTLVGQNDIVGFRWWYSFISNVFCTKLVIMNVLPDDILNGELPCLERKKKKKKEQKKR